MIKQWGLKQALWAFILLLFFATAQAKSYLTYCTTCNLLFNNHIELRDIPVALTLSQQMKGLSQQKDIHQGLFFLWQTEAPRTFWMRNTYIPLTIGFFSKDGTLFLIEDMKPETDILHSSHKPAMYALELPQGQFEQLGLKVGTKLIFKDCKISPNP